MKTRSWLSLFLLATLLAAAAIALPVRAQTVIYVDASAEGANNGTSWANAFTDLQSALAAGGTGTGTDIWVAQGVYAPSFQTDGSDPRTATFIMMNGVALYGGFPSGGGDGTFEARDWATNSTVLSGDIGTPGNSYHVVVADDTDDTAVLDGFVITAGNANALSGRDRSGGGMYISGGSPMLRNIAFRDNWARDGGGLYAANGSSPTLINCRFENNEAEQRGGAIRAAGTFAERHGLSLTNVMVSGNRAGLGGGALYSNYSLHMTLIDVTFALNVADSESAGAAYIASPEGLILENVEFVENHVGSSGTGGALYLTSAGDAVLNNVTFSGNFSTGPEGAASGVGGAMFVTGGTTFALHDVTFDSNYATDGGRTGGMHIQLGTGNLTNATFVGNHAAGGGALWLERGTLTATGCRFEGNWAQAGGALYVGDAPGLATATLVNCTLVGNTAFADGGAMYISHRFDVGTDTLYPGTVTLRNSTVSGNHAAHDGGAVYNSGTLNLIDSTISDNTANGAGAGTGFPDGGGGILNFGGSVNYDTGILNAVNTTISGNRAASHGGGILNSYTAQLSLWNVTITENLANSTNNDEGQGGGLALIDSGPWTVRNSIIAGNQDGTALTPSPDCHVGNRVLTTPLGTTIHSLLGDTAGCGTNFAGDGNIVGVDPLLGRLGDNGGPTLTHALLSGSPARDAGDPADCPDADQRGMVRPRDSAGDGSLGCDMGAFEAGPPNDAWTRAIDISTGPADVQEYVDQRGQSRWYRFQVTPGSRVEVALDPGNVNLDIALFGDIEAAYDELLAPEEESDLPRLSAEFAAAAHSPFAYSPFAYSPFAYSPFAYSPFAYSPFAYSPFAYSPFAYSPFAYSPFAYSPFAYSPFAYSPFAYSPFAYSPFAYSPFAYSPNAYSPEREYTSAQMRTLLAISALEGTASEFIEVNTWDNRGYFYVRISGRNGAFDLSQPYTLRVTQDLGVCEGLAEITRDGALTVESGSYQAIFLTDWGRFDQSDDQLTELQAALIAFAPSVGGVVVDVGHDPYDPYDPYVQAANAVADSAPECLYAKNQVAGLIKDYVTAYRDAGHPLEYVVLVGNDNVIPYFRYPDRAEIGRERDYNPPVLVGTSSYASLAFDHFLGQDAYGSTIELSIQNTTLPLPDLAVGRLVETPADILSMLEAYGKVAGSVEPESALVTGYCFLADAAEAIAWELETGLGNGSVNTLITPQEISPAQREGTPPEDAPWPASLLADNLFGQRHDLIFLAGHFSAQGALAADYETRLYAYELLASGVDLENALVYSAGCHSGYNIVNEHGVPFVTLEPDWAQAFAQKGATFVGGTGYQYGDTDFLEYSERLYLEFTRELRCGDGSVGKALVRAKQAYLVGITDMIGIDEKAVQISTLFGLPMFTVDGLDKAGCPAAAPISIVTTPQHYDSDPGEFLGLRYANVTVVSHLTEVTVPLRSVVEPADTYLPATYYSGTDGAVTKPAEPVLPLERRNVHVADHTLRGVGFRGGSYTDQSGVIPLTGGATTETRAARTPFQTDVLYPLQPWSVNHFAQLIDPDIGITWLDVKPAQFISDPVGGGWTGTWRRFDNAAFRLFYSNHTATLGGGAVPSLASPPAILQVLAASGEGEVHFQVTVAGDPAAGVQEVWVTYTGLSCDGGAICWQSLDLIQNANDSTLWEGSLAHASAASGEIRYMVQAVNGVGLVTLLTNHGEYYQVDVDPADPASGADPASPPKATFVEFQTVPSSGAYSTEAAFSASLLDSDGAPIPGQRITFALGAQQRSALTDTSGLATVSIPLNVAPGTYEVSVTYAGSADYERLSATSPFTVEKQSTTVTFLEDLGLVVELTDAESKPMPHKTVLFVISSEYHSWVVAETTNLLGQARPGGLILPVGSYDVTIYFGQEVEVFTQVVNLTDLYYDGASAVAHLEVLPDPDTEIVSLTLPLDSVETGTEVRAVARFAGGKGPHTAVWDWGDGTSCDTSEGGACALTKPFDWVPGEVSGTHTYSGPGAYAGILTIQDVDGISVFETFIVNVMVAPESAPEILDLELPIDPVAIGSEIEGTAIFLGSNSPHTAIWDWGDGTQCDTSEDNSPCELSEPTDVAPGTVTGTHAYTETGVYAVRLTVTDDKGNESEALYEFVVVYDPQGSFVTGGGWIWSEAGWCHLDEACALAEGRASFGFVSRYRRGANVPTGNTQFNFSAGGFTFQSDAYQWLVVTMGGTNAQFKGSGMINGQVSSNGDLYEFMVWARDGGRRGEDTFRIKVWYQDGSGDEVTVYDNGFDQVIGGGSIVVH